MTEEVIQLDDVWKIFGTRAEEAMQAKLTATSRHMQAQHGPTKATDILNDLLGA